MQRTEGSVSSARLGEFTAETTVSTSRSSWLRLTGSGEPAGAVVVDPVEEFADGRRALPCRLGHEREYRAAYSLIDLYGTFKLDTHPAVM